MLPGWMDVSKLLPNDEYGVLASPRLDGSNAPTEKGSRLDNVELLSKEIAEDAENNGSHGSTFLFRLGDSGGSFDACA